MSPTATWADSVPLSDLQSAVIGHQQLLAAGVGRRGIERRVATGRLHRLHEGVFLVGHSVAPPGADRRAALLACGPSSAISHRSGGEDWLLIPRDPGNRVVDVTIAGRAGRARPGIRIHRPRFIDPRDLTRLNGVPMTTVPRTLLDLAECAEFRVLERAFDEALTRHLTTTRALIRAAGLPEPELNLLLLGRYRADFAWREFRLIVETDGHRYHASRARRRADNRRDSDLRSAGWRVERFTDDEIALEPEATVARLTRALYAAT